MGKIKEIKKRNGVVGPFNPDKITIAIFKAAKSVGGHDMTKAEEISKKVLNSLELEANGEILSVEHIQDAVEKTLVEGGHYKTAKAFIIYRYERGKNREKTKEILDGKIDTLKITHNALQVLERRYLLKDINTGKLLETPEDMFRRVANNVAEAEKKYSTKNEEKGLAEKFYNMLSTLEFLPNSPCLMNAGTSIQQLSACFVLPIEDSMESIFTTLKNTALIHKSGGGTGFSFSKLRSKSSSVKSTQGVASGPVSFMTAYNAATEVVKQGGKRRGANMAVLRVDHPDIIDFITCKENNDTLNNFNISVGLTEEFMKAVENDEDYDLIEPHNKKVVTRVSARQVFDLIVVMAWKNGEPGMIFLDRMNKDNPTPHIGKIESTNPCGEQPLLPYESCNLGSINLSRFINKEETDFDWAKLKEITKLSVRFMDNLIDMNKFPLSEITNMVNNNRKIGLGIMGFADALYKLKIRYGSDEGINIAKKVMKFIRNNGRKESIDLAKIKGVFPNYEGSLLEKENRPQRNATITTIAPTGTLSMIADCSGGCEPVFALAYIKNVMDNTELSYMHDELKRVLKERGLNKPEIMKKIAEQGSVQHIEEIPEDIKNVFVTSHDITPIEHIKMQAAFQDYTDNAVSKTVNFSSEASIADIDEVYRLAYKLNCKGVTVYRDGSRGMQIMNVGNKVNEGVKRNVEELATKLKETILNKGKKKNDLPKLKLSKKVVDKSKCPECGAKMQFKEGCATCPDCGFSYCSSA
jgi:ribonucleoside-diphosphate reductase alpha chain